MKQQGLAYFSDVNLIVVAMLLFFFAFLAIGVWVSRRSNQPFFEEMSKLPLQDSEGDQR